MAVHAADATAPAPPSGSAMRSPPAPADVPEDIEALAPAAIAATSRPNLSNTKSSANDKHCDVPFVMMRARTGFGDRGDDVAVGVAVIVGVTVADGLGDAVTEAVTDGEMPNVMDADGVAVIDDVNEAVMDVVMDMVGEEVDVDVGVGANVGTAYVWIIPPLSTCKPTTAPPWLRKDSVAPDSAAPIDAPSEEFPNVRGKLLNTTTVEML